MNNFNDRDIQQLMEIIFERPFFAAVGFILGQVIFGTIGGLAGLAIGHLTERYLKKKYYR